MNSKNNGYSFIKKETETVILNNIIPMCEDNAFCIRGGIKRYQFGCVNFQNRDDFIGFYNNILDRYSSPETSEDTRKLLIISDDIGLIRKTAAMISCIPINNVEDDLESKYEEEYDILLDDYYTDDYEEESTAGFNLDYNTWVEEIDLTYSNYSGRKDMLSMSSRTMFPMAVRNYLFINMFPHTETDTYILEKLDTIKCCQAERKIIAIPPNYFNTRWVRQLLCNDYSVIVLPDAKEHMIKVAKSYYTNITNSFDDIEAEKIYNNARQDIGSCISEEDYVWYYINNNNLKMLSNINTRE